MKWCTYIDDPLQAPTPSLDTINVDLASLNAKVQKLVRGGCDHNIRTDALLMEATILENKFKDWVSSIPSSELPAIVSGDSISPSIQTYQSYCHVYSSIPTAALWNRSRLFQIRLQLISLTLLNHHISSPMAQEQRKNCHEIIQQHVDDMCATVPFILGDLLVGGGETRQVVCCERMNGFKWRYILEVITSRVR